jgi:hypothetical protein
LSETIKKRSVITLIGLKIERVSVFLKILIRGTGPSKSRNNRQKMEVKN